MVHGKAWGVDVDQKSFFDELAQGAVGFAACEVAELFEGLAGQGWVGLEVGAHELADFVGGEGVGVFFLATAFEGGFVEYFVAKLGICTEFDALYVDVLGTGRGWIGVGDGLQGEGEVAEAGDVHAVAGQELGADFLVEFVEHGEDVAFAEGAAFADVVDEGVGVYGLTVTYAGVIGRFAGCRIFWTGCGIEII